MATSNITRYETSVAEGMPIECYKFTYNDINYLYTSSAEDIELKITKDHVIAKLYQGPPPESPVKLTVYRLHEQDITKFDVVLKAQISQVSFNDSECILTATMENWLKYYGGYVRMITEHIANCITIKYPFVTTPRNDVIVVPGCDHLFKTCALRFKNHLNFTGVPYCPPTDSEKNPTGKGVYWIDSEVVQRDTDGFVGTITM